MNNTGYRQGVTGLPTIQMAVGEKLDYPFNWAEWLVAGDTIDTYEMTVGEGITKVSDAKVSGTLVTVVLESIGVGSFPVACEIVTTPGGRRPIRTIMINVVPRLG